MAPPPVAHTGDHLPEGVCRTRPVPSRDRRDRLVPPIHPDLFGRTVSRRGLLAAAGAGLATAALVSASPAAAASAATVPRIDTLALFRQTYPGGLRTLHVSGAGDDARSGLRPDQAKRSIQAAVDISRPGDRIVVATGSYGHTEFFDRHGTPTAWITIEAAPGARAVVDVSASRASWDRTRWTNGLDVQLSSHVGVHGLEIRGDQASPDPDPSGVAVFRRSRAVAIWACDVHDFPGGGVNCFATGAATVGGTALPAGGWDAVDVFFNRVHATSRRSTYNTSGISFFGGQSLGSSVGDGRYGYRAVGNHVFDVVCKVPYVPGGFDFVTDGNGISVDSLAVPNSLSAGLPPYPKRGLVEGNVVVACGGRGVYVYNSRDVDVVNNTVVGNLRTASPAITGSTDIAVVLDRPVAHNGVVIANNVIAPLSTARAFDRVAQTVVGNTALGGTDPVPGGNSSQRRSGLSAFRIRPSVASLAAGLDPASLAPRVDRLVARRSGSSGLPVLGRGTRAVGSTIPVGAVRNG